MSALFKQLEIVLSASNIQPELEAELILVDSHQQCWRLYCAPALRLQSIKFEDLNRFDCCKLQISENTLLSILKNEISAQDALEQKLVTVDGSVPEILRANVIIDSLRGQAFVESLS